MYSTTKTGDKDSPYVVDIVADTDADLANLPTHYAAGSTCIVIQSSSVYMLNHDKEWKQL